MNRPKEPLYRKVNTKAHNVHHHKGPDAANERNSKKGMSTKMVRGAERGLDYTPLYRFLLSKVGKDFNDVHSEAVSRLDHEDPIWHMVIQSTDRRIMNGELPKYIISGESSYYSALYVDDNNILQLVDPDFHNENLKPSCWCCTHTFNGKPFIKKWNSK